MNGYTIITLSHWCTRHCNLITEFNLPNSLTSIDYVGLTALTGLTKLVIPPSIETIGDYFDAMTNCVKIIFAKNSKLTSVGKAFLRNCPKLESITLPLCCLILKAGIASEETRC